MSRPTTKHPASTRTTTIESTWTALEYSFSDHSQITFSLQTSIELPHIFPGSLHEPGRYLHEHILQRSLMAAERRDAKSGANHVAEQIGFRAFIAIVGENGGIAVDFQFVNIGACGKPGGDALHSAEHAQSHQ